MSDWVHCNKCAAKHGSQATFFLVECGHIVCQRCVETIRSSRACVICNKTGNVIALNKDVEQSVMDFFLPVENVLKKGIEIYKFQLQHRNCLYQKLVAKYNYAKKEYMNFYNTNKTLQKENQTLRSMLQSAGKNPRRFMTSTPVSQPSEANVTFQNTSLVSSIRPQMQTPRSGLPMVKMYPGYPKRNQLLSSGSSHGPSPAQRVPFGQGRPMEVPGTHRSSLATMRSMDQLRRGNKSQ